MAGYCSNLVDEPDDRLAKYSLCFLLIADYDEHLLRFSYCAFKMPTFIFKLLFLRWPWLTTMTALQGANVLLTQALLSLLLESSTHVLYSTNISIPNQLQSSPLFSVEQPTPFAIQFGFCRTQAGSICQLSSFYVLLLYMDLSEYIMMAILTDIEHVITDLCYYSVLLWPLWPIVSIP